MERLQGKRAVVTGAAQGIGAAIAQRLAAEGAMVAVLDLDGDKAATVLPSPHVAFACDVRDSASVDAAFAQVRVALGGVVVSRSGRCCESGKRRLVATISICGVSRAAVSHAR